MPSTVELSLSADEIDDLLYFTRVNEAEELEQTLSALSQEHNCSRAQILSHCADPLTKNTVLHYASANGFAKLLQTLLGMLKLGNNGKDADYLGELVNGTNREGNTALHWAAYNGHLEVVKELIGVGADMWIKNSAGHLAMFEAERADKTEVVQFLLEAGGAEVERTGRTSAVTEEDLADVQVPESSTGVSTEGGRDVDMEDGVSSG